jgi:HK97 family phage major capsid protein
MDINSIILELEKKIAGHRRHIEMTLDGAKRDGRPNLTKAEDLDCERHFDLIDADKRSLARAKAVQAEDSETNAAMRESHSTGAYVNRQDRTSVVSITHEARTYNPGNDPKGTSFLRDVARASVFGDPEAQSRLSRHMTEERVERPGQYMERAAGDLVTGSIGGVVVPRFLIDQTALAVAARRPFADACTPHQLPPEGMTLTIPVFTTGTAVTNQATQLSGVASQSMVESDLTLNVYTAAGQQNVSRQAVDRSRIDEFVLSDLMARYATNLDSQLLNMATVGLSAKALGTLGAYADTQPTGAKLYPKLLAASSGVEAVTLGACADVCVMHSRRWSWLSKEMTTSWPLINSDGIPTQAAGTSGPNRDYGSGVRGVLPNGMRVVVDNNVTTTANANQDEIYVVPSSECHLYEDANAPAYVRCDQTNASTLGVLFVVYGYYSFTYDRFGAGSMQKVTGTGLTTPTF